MELAELRERAKKIKLIISDMDGSLLNSKKQISERNLATVIRVREAGYNFTIATGRMGDTLDAHLARLKIDGYFIASNGAELMSASGEVLMRNAISEDAADYIFRSLDDVGIQYYLETVCNYWVRAGSPLEGIFIQGHKQALEGNQRFKLNRFEGNPISWIKGQELLKILVGNQNEQERQTIIKIAKDCGKVSCTSSGDGIIEIVAPGCDKGKALKKLAGVLGLDAGEICAIGDFDNDISMLDFAGIAIAMGNAHEKVLKVADYVTDTNDNNGVAAALEKLFF